MVRLQKAKPHMKDVALMVDAMTIYKSTIWDPKKKRYIGTVDYGTTFPEIENELTT